MLTSKLSFENGTNQTPFIDVSIKQIATDYAVMPCAMNLNAMPAARREKPANRREPDPSRTQRQALDTLREKGP